MPQSVAVVVTSLIILMWRACSALNVWTSNYFFDMSESFTIPLILSLITCVISTGFYIIYVESQRKQDSFKINNITEIKFKMSELKNFSLRAYMLIVMNFATYGVYFAFQSMMTETLRDGFGQSDEAAERLILINLITQSLILVITMVLSKLTNNQSAFIFIASVVGATCIMIVPSVGQKSLVMAWVFVMLHSIYGGILDATYFACFNNSVSQSLMSIGTGLCASTHIAMTIMPLITGYFMGKKATKISIYDCCWFFAGFQILGVICSVILLMTEKTYEEELEKVERPRLISMKSLIELETMIHESNLKENQESQAKSKKFISNNSKSTFMDTEVELASSIIVENN